MKFKKLIILSLVFASMAVMSQSAFAIKISIDKNEGITLDTSSVKDDSTTVCYQGNSNLTVFEKDSKITITDKGSKVTVVDKGKKR